MGILSNLIAPEIQAAVPDPADDFWYTSSPGLASRTGVHVTAETALTVSTVFACVAAIAQDVAAMPSILYRRLPEGGQERATDLFLYWLLHDQPNNWQTSQEWYETVIGHAVLRGNHYSLIQSGPQGFVQQLIPLDPTRMRVEQLSNFRLRYEYRWEDGNIERFPQDRIFHVRGLSTDGLTGLGVVSAAREAIGLAKATEEYGARFFGQSAEPRGVLQLDGTLNQDAYDRLKVAWQDAHGGLSGAHKVAILERGVKWQQVGLSNEDSQFLEARRFQVEDIARWFGVPLGRIGHTDKATTWGTGLEQSNLWYISYGLLPWIKRVEKAITRDLIMDKRRLLSKFLMDHLLRGDTTARFTAYGMAIRDGWMTRNEVRAKEDLNPAEGLDNYLLPQNMAMIDEDGEVIPVNTPAPAPVPAQEQNRPGQETDSRTLMLATALASHTVKREMATATKTRARYTDEAKLSSAMDLVYEQLAALMVENLRISAADARAYCDRQKAHPETSQEEKIRQVTELVLRGI